MEHRNKLEIFNPTSLALLDPEGLLKAVLPKISNSIEDCGGRSQTNYMTENFTLDHPTTIGNATRVMKHIWSMRGALQENYFKTMRAKRKLKRLKLNPFSDKLDIQELELQFQNATLHYNGALKTCVVLCRKYREYCAELDVDNITEEMVNANEPMEQHMRMWMQSYEEAIGNGGIVDTGDLRYARQCGIDPSECQYEVNNFLFDRNNMKVNTPSDTKKWLYEMWKKYGARV